MKKIFQLFELLPQLFNQRNSLVRKSLIKGHIANRISNTLVFTSESPAYFFSELDRNIQVDNKGNFEISLPIHAGPIQFTLYIDQSISITELFIEPAQQLFISLDANRPDFVVFKSKDSSAYNNTVGQSHRNRLKDSDFIQLLRADRALLPTQFCRIIDKAAQEELRFWEGKKTQVSRAYYENRRINAIALLAGLKDNYIQLYAMQHIENIDSLLPDYWDFIQDTPQLQTTHLSCPETCYLINLQLEIAQPHHTALWQKTAPIKLLDTASTIYTDAIREFALAYTVQRSLFWERDHKKIGELMKHYHNLSENKNYIAYLERQYAMFQSDYKQTGS